MSLDKSVREIIEANIRAASNADEDAARPFKRKIAKALEIPLRDTIKDGLLINEIFEPITFPTGIGSTISFPVAILDNEQSHSFKAYAAPECGYVPHNVYSHGEVRVTTYRIANSADICIKFIEEGRWDIVEDLYSIVRNGFEQKMNDDGYHVVMTAANSRGEVVEDSAASGGEFTKELITKMGVRMTRLGGGNTASNGRFVLTDLLVSPEALAQMYNWSESIIDPLTRREMNSKGAYDAVELHRVKVRALEDLGVGQAYQSYIVDTLGNAMSAGDTEYVIGLDLSHKTRGFVMPVKKELELFEDNLMHRAGMWGIYGHMDLNFAQLDSRLSILGSF